MSKHSDFHRERTSTVTLKMPVNENMISEYSMGAGRSLMVKKKSDVYSIMIFEMGSDNRGLKFPLVRWSPFTRAFDEIDNAVNDLQTNHQLKYSYHIAGGYNVSVTAGYWCVDIRPKIFKLVVTN